MKAKNAEFFKFLQKKSLWVTLETLKIHKLAPQTRLASALSSIEIFVALYYGRILKFNPKNLKLRNRDRFIASKGHGAFSLYPVLADLGFFHKKELGRVCQEGSCFGSIPDSLIPGFETMNGSLGNGLGVGCGMALGLKNQGMNSRVFVLVGDGELYEGANWEAIMFARQHKLGNLVLIVDDNKISMLDYCKNIIDLAPLAEKFKAFKWKVKTVDGHDLKELYFALKELKNDKENQPKVLIANTRKGKGVSSLEGEPICHVKSVKNEELDALICQLRDRL
jgi:transketolase